VTVQDSDQWDAKYDYQWSLKGVDVDHIVIREKDWTLGNEADCLGGGNLTDGKVSYSGDHWLVLAIPLKPGTATGSMNSKAPFSLEEFVLQVESDVMAKRVEKALVHAVVLCGGAKLEPF
jgi:hypothetical protein